MTMRAIDNCHAPQRGHDLRPRDPRRRRRPAIKTVTTGPNGRTAEPLFLEDVLKVGHSELLMHFEAYSAKTGASLPGPNVLSLVPVRFVIRDARQRYHLPVLFTQWGYSYYRGR